MFLNFPKESMDNLNFLQNLNVLFIETSESIKNNILVKNESSLKSVIKFIENLIDKL